MLFTSLIAKIQLFPKTNNLPRTFFYKKFRGEEFGGVEVRPIGEQMLLVPHYIHDVTGGLWMEFVACQK